MACNKLTFKYLFLFLCPVLKGNAKHSLGSSARGDSEHTLESPSQVWQDSPPTAVLPLSRLTQSKQSEPQGSTSI